MTLSTNPVDEAPASTMRAVYTGDPGAVEVREVPIPTVGPEDVLVRMRACGICGTDLGFVAAGGMPYLHQPIALGHEPAGEVVDVGSRVTDVSVGDHVVVNPMSAPSGIIGNGGSLGGLRELLLIENARVGRDLAIIPESLPFWVAALNEPLAVAKHLVNRGAPLPSESAVVFGAGPIGLGAAIWLKLAGVSHVVVVDVVRARLDKAIDVGADAVIDSSTEDVTARLMELHGEATNAIGMPRPATDLYLDAAGAPSVLQTAIASAKWGARLVMAGVHKQPELIDTGQMMIAELTFSASMGYPTEIFEVTADLIAHQERFAKLVSHRIDFGDVESAVELASTPGATDKVVITFGP